MIFPNQQRCSFPIQNLIIWIKNLIKMGVFHTQLRSQSQWAFFRRDVAEFNFRCSTKNHHYQSISSLLRFIFNSPPIAPQALQKAPARHPPFFKGLQPFMNVDLTPETPSGGHQDNLFLTFFWTHSCLWCLLSLYVSGCSSPPLLFPNTLHLIPLGR